MRIIKSIFYEYAISIAKYAIQISKYEPVFDISLDILTEYSRLHYSVFVEI